MMNNYINERICKMLNGIEILDVPEIVNMLKENNIEVVNVNNNFEFLLNVIYQSCLMDANLIDKFNVYINKKSMELCKKAEKEFIKDLKEFGGNDMDKYNKIRKRTEKVAEYLYKLSYEEVCNILKQSDRIIQLPNESDLFSRNILNELACQACLIDMKILVNFEIAIAEKFENRIEENIKNYKDKILTTPLTRKISNDLDKMKEINDNKILSGPLSKTSNCCIPARLTNDGKELLSKEVIKQIGDKHFVVPKKERTMEDIVEQRKLYKKIDKDRAEEMKKEMNEKYEKAFDRGVCSDYDGDNISSDNIKDIIRYIIRDNGKNIEVNELNKSESDKELKDSLDKLGKLFNIRCHENFVNTVKEKLEETTIDEDQEINRDCNDKALEDCIRTIVLNNKYFDSELTAELYNRSYDYPMEVVNEFFQDYIDCIELDKLYVPDEDYDDNTIYNQEDLDCKVIDAITDFIFENDDKRYLIEFAIRLYKFYNK